MWKYSGSQECGPDGCRSAGFSGDALNSADLLGALIGKIGGSPADKPGEDTPTFVAGTYTIVLLEDKKEGPLYLTMNDQVTHFDEHSGEIEVTIEYARSG